MFAGIRNYAQKTAAGMMKTPVTIRHKKPFQKDPSAPYGDDTLEFEPETTTVMGWKLTSLSQRTTEDGVLADVAMSDLLRLPAGTRIDTGDEVTFGVGGTWTVVDVNDDDLYPAMTRVSIQQTQ